MPGRKKLIEVALPLQAINAASAREKSIRHGHPSTLHLWWARRPRAAARAVIFAQMVDDPSGYVDTLRSDGKLRRQAESLLKGRRKRWEEATALFDKARKAGISAPEPGPEPRLDDILAEVERNRELKVWRKAMEAAKGVYRLAPLLPREETYGMRSQITRAAASVPANIAEGWTRESDKEKAQFLAVAQGSLAEVETFLTLCEDLGWFPKDKTQNLREAMTEVGKMLTVLRRNFRANR